MKNDLLLKALKGETVDRPPVWMMRQAGRYLPDFMKLKDKYDFFTRCQTPELATEITLMPIDQIGVDAAIIFSDILVVLQAMDIKVEMRDGIGPYLPQPIRDQGALEKVINAKPDVFNHNLETVPRLYPTVRPGARYFHSLNLLAKVKEVDPNIFTKSGIMVGLGESQNEIYQVMDDMRSAEIDFLTIGQYLQPTIKHHKVEKFVNPNEFEQYKKVALSKGFLLVSSSPLTRSSFHASEDFEKLKKIRTNQLNN